MANLEISEQAAEQLSRLSKETQKTIDEVIRCLLDTHAQTLAASTDNETEMLLTEDELVDILTPLTPLTGKQIAEAGLLGGWKDRQIGDSLEWLDQQRAKRRNNVT